MIEMEKKIVHVGKYLFEIRSFTNPKKTYVVDVAEGTCTCPDFVYRGRRCKHIRFLEEHGKQPATPEAQEFLNTCVKYWEVG